MSGTRSGEAPSRRRAVGGGALLLAALLLWGSAPPASAAGGTTLGPLRQVSGQTLFADCTADNLPGQTGTVFLSSEVEPWVDVNPTDPKNIVGTWQQDRWSNGGARGLVAGVTFDGGESWEQMAIPGLSRCSGGNFVRASDPWLSFGPDGSLHHISLSFNPGISVTAMLVNTSTDGGRTWTAPVRLILNSLPFFNDKESITADPTDASLVYAIWDRLDLLRGRGPALFTRSTDGGFTWEPVQLLHDPGSGRQTIGGQVVVQPDGTVFAFFTEVFSSNIFFMSFKRSDDQGARWVPFSSAFRVRQMLPQQAIAAEAGLAVRDGFFLLDLAVDPNDGRLYAVWQNGGLTGFQFPVVALSMSADDGATWTLPAIVNGTPPVAPRNRQAFLPSVHVSANGTIGVSYYDFRFNGDEPGVWTDHWLTWCHPDAKDCSQSSRWRHEVRVTEGSFDILQAPFARGLFLGDYTGLAAAGDAFVVFYTQPHDLDLASAFLREVVPDTTVEPEGTGFWKHQLRAALSGRGAVQEGPARLQEYLDDVRALHDVFDAVTDLPALAAVLDPPASVSARARARAQLMALLLNLASDRLVPWAAVEESRTVTDAVASVVAVVADDAAERQSLLAAKDLAEAINAGRIPLQ